MATRHVPAALVPIRCVEPHPTKKTLRFAGVAINLTRLAESIDPPVSVAQLSRIFSRKQDGSMRLIRVIAEALGMDLRAFLAELDRIEDELGQMPVELGNSGKGVDNLVTQA
jgi:hypothetical protein